LKQWFSRCAPEVSCCFRDLTGPYLTYRLMWYFSGGPELTPVVLQPSQVQASSKQASHLEKVRRLLEPN